MDIFDYKGICLKEDKRAVYLDPANSRPDAAVTHAHSDHLRPNTHMTKPTAEIMKVRTGSTKATTHNYHEKFKITQNGSCEIAVCKYRSKNARTKGL